MTTEALLTQAPTGSFDTDSKPVGVDNRCTACISHDIADFVGDVTPSNRWIKGFGGSKTNNVRTGTIRWSLEDDEGKVHTFYIPKSYYVKQGGVRLLSPQHWAQTQRDTMDKGTGSLTTSKQVELFWKDKRYSKTIPLGTGNVATLCLAPGYSRFEAFCAKAEVLPELEDAQPMRFETNVISDDEGGDSDDEREEEIEDPRAFPSEPVPTSFDLDGPTPEGAVPVIIEDEEDR